MRTLHLLLPSLIVVSACTAARPIDVHAVSRRVLETLNAQQEAWNRGDIRGFMDGYRNAQETTFVSGTNLKRGHREVLEGYLKNYPAGRQGKLQFHIVEIRPVAADAAYVLGRYELAGDRLQTGFFTLVLREVDGRFVVVHDHTCADGPAPAAPPKED
jgi:ketosteroid isomerase-like protein